MKLLLLLLLGMFLGCALTPKEVMEASERSTHRAANAPYAAAACIARNAESPPAGLVVTVRSLNVNDSTEVILTSIAGKWGIVAVAHVEPAGSGSQVTFGGINGLIQ